MMILSKLQNRAASSQMELPKIELPKTRFSEDLGEQDIENILVLSS